MKMVTQSHAAPAQINGSGSRRPGNVTSTEALNDLEFRELLEELTLRINMDKSTVEPVPGLDVYRERPVPVAPLRASRAAPLPVRRRGVSTNLTAAIISLSMAAGTGWLYLSY